MRMRIALALALTSLLTAPPAMADAPPPPPQAPMAQEMDVPLDKGPQHVGTLVREFPVGGGIGWHVHPGVEIGFLVEGEMTLEEEGKPVRRMKSGDSFLVPRGVVHSAVNIGKVPSRLVITFVTDKGAPVRTMVPAPSR
jgi:quercetin dioxygenase-like cupin family protein